MIKFFQILQVLTSAERIRLRKFAASPYFNETAWLSPFINAVLLRAEDTDWDACASELFQAAFAKKEDSTKDISTKSTAKKDVSTKENSDKPFQQQLYNRLLSDATTFLLEFLEVENRKKTPHTLAQLFLDRKNYKRYALAMQQWRNDLNAETLTDAAHYTDCLALECLGLRYSQTETQRTERSNLEAVHRNLDLSFLIQKLRYTCEILNRQNILQHRYTAEGVEHVLTWLQTSDYRREPAVAVYLCVYELLLQPENARFQTLIQALQQHEARFSNDELYELYTYANNFCIKEINKGNEPFLQIFLQIAERLLQNKVLLRNDKISVATYKNIVTIGLRAGEYAKMENFIQTYSSFLPFEHRENAQKYNLAKLYFAQAAYNKVLDCLRDVDYDNLFYALDCRWLLLKTYFIQREEVALESAMQAFRVYLLRNKTIATTTKQQYLQLIIVLKKVILLPLRDVAYAQRLYAEIEAKKTLADKAWLLAEVLGFTLAKIQ